MIFVDTSFWIALAFPRDEHHAAANKLIELYADASLLTSNHVRGEAWTFLRRKTRHSVAVGFLDYLERTPRLDVFSVPGEIEREALAWLRQHEEREYSFVDATSFALMRALRIQDALAFDGDFNAAGFVELRA